mgnify:FL=1
MASEIRANKQTNRVGLGTVTYTDTGIIVSGIVTTTGVSGLTQIEVGNNIKLGNAGVITATSFSGDGSNLTGVDSTALKDSAGNVKIQAQASGAMHTGVATFSSGLVASGAIAADNDIYVDGHTYLGNVSIAGTSAVLRGLNVGSNIQLGNAGVVTATSFSGDGSGLSNLPAGAPVGGASTNTVFFENDTAVAVNYQVTSGKNAMSAGPIAINAGIAVTVPSGSSWTIV